MPSYCKHGTLLDAGDFCDKEDEQDCPLCFIEFFPARNQQIHDALTDKDKRIAELEAENQRLREALEIIAGKRQCVDNLMGNVEIAMAALLGGGE